MAGEFAREQAAQVWCTKKTSGIVMDVVLCDAIADKIEELVNQAWLGNATTKQLLDEITARVDLDYKTVNDK